MRKKIKHLIVNIGSASKKYALYEDKEELANVHFEKEDGGFVAAIVSPGLKEKLDVSKRDFDAPLPYLLNNFIKKGFLDGKKDISAIAMRIVAPGRYFLLHRFVDKEYLEKLNEARERAPLHLYPMINEIKHLKKFFPGTPILGVSDSAFHATMPAHSRYYSLPQKISAKLDIYRYGYHGISFEYALSRIKKLLGYVPARMIVCHLGSGSSITALYHGKSVDTSMGFTPLEGLPMSTRIGNIDAGAVIYLAEKMKLSLLKLQRYLNLNCGLLGLSGKTDDVRELLALEKKGDEGAKLALETLIYHIKKHIGAYAAVLGGVDVLVFTATIGERSFIMRRRICSGLRNLGIKIDKEKNNKTAEKDGFINSQNSRMKIAVIHANEMKEMAKCINF